MKTNMVRHSLFTYNIFHYMIHNSIAAILKVMKQNKNVQEIHYYSFLIFLNVLHCEIVLKLKMYIFVTS